jgi:hypothetical protein
VLALVADAELDAFQQSSRSITECSHSLGHDPDERSACILSAKGALVKHQEDCDTVDCALQRCLDDLDSPSDRMHLIAIELGTADVSNESMLHAIFGPASNNRY